MNTHVDDVDNRADVVSAAGTIVLYDRGQLFAGNAGVNRSMILDVALKNRKELGEIADYVRPLYGEDHHFLAKSLAIALMFLANRTGLPGASEFIADVYLGSHSNNVAFDLREQLQKNARAKRKFQRRYLAALLFKSFVLFSCGERPQVLTFRRGEPFPVLKKGSAAPEAGAQQVG